MGSVAREPADASSDPSAKGRFTTGYEKETRDRYAARTADTCCAYLFPYLEKLPPAFTFLDVGCGPGSITTDLAKRYPRAHFVGVDPGESFIEKAAVLAEERRTPNVSFEVGDVMTLDRLPEHGTFDVVHCHQVLVHVPDKLGAITSMKRAARSRGGLVAAREADVATGIVFYPALEPIKEWQHLLVQIGLDNGSDPGLGAKLVGLALDAGWRRDQITATAGVWCYSQPEEKRVWAESIVGSLENEESSWYKRALAAGATPEALRTMMYAWKTWQHADDAWSSFVSGEIVCSND